MKAVRRNGCTTFVLRTILWGTIGAAACLSDEPLSADDGALAAAGSQDLLILGPLEPIHVRLGVDVDGRPFRQIWLETFQRLFDQFDLDRDAKLTVEQAGQITAAFARSAGPTPNADNAGKAMLRDNTISRDELHERIERAAPALSLRQRLSSGGAGPALIPLLDADGDGRLSREELRAAEQSLHCRDFNDDQLITEQELLAGPSQGSSENSPATEGSVILLTPALDPAAVAEILLSRYDRNRDGLLSLRIPAEILSVEGRLAALDADHDESLSRAELRGYLDLPVDAELAFNLGGGGAGRKPVAALPQYQLRRKLDGGFRLHVGASEINFRRNNRDPAQDNTRPRMRDFDADTNESLDANEFMNVPDRPEFAVIDVDRDEKLTEAEFEGFFLQRSRAAAAQLVLEASDQGSDLFTTLDRNFDRVLTPRELHTAVQLLETEDRDGDGFLGGVEMSYNLVLEISRGGPRAPANTAAALRAAAEPHVKAERTGPVWFQKMDRNRDGDVSVPEFVGDRAAFAKLDQNADELISAEEAAGAAR